MSAASDSSQEDRGPLLLSVSWSLTVVSSLFLALRLYCKVRTRRNLWWDDAILIAGWVRDKHVSFFFFPPSISALLWSHHLPT